MPLCLPSDRIQRIAIGTLPDPHDLKVHAIRRTPEAAPLEPTLREALDHLRGHVAILTVGIGAGIEVNRQSPGVHGHDPATLAPPDIKTSIESLQFPGQPRAQ